MTKIERLPNRKYYVPSGQVNWAKFLPFVLLALVGSIVGAWLLAFLFRHGFYFVGIIPVLFGLGTAGLTILAVKQAHCRSRLIGAALGIVTGLILHLGYYYFDACHSIGLGLLPVRIVPSYIHFRLQNDVLRDTHSSDEKPESVRPHPERIYINSVIFLIELGIIVGMAGAAGFRRASKPYCERCQKWMSREITRFDPLKTDALVQALKNSSTPALLPIFASPEFPSVPNASFAFDVCPSLKAGHPVECAAFFSIKQIHQNPKGVNLDAFDSSKGKLLVHFAHANAEELPLMAARFPFLAAHKGSLAPNLVVPPPPAPAIDSKTAPCVDTKPLPPEFSGRVLTRRNILIGNALSISILIGCFGGIGLAALGGITAFPDHPPAGGVSAVTKTFGILLMAIGLPLFCICAFLGVTNVGFFSNRWLRNVTRRELKRRPANLVDPDAPDARFVEVVPKLNWGKMMLETASDVGFLTLDKPRGLVLFEGDKECYRIPVQAIVSCAMEIFVQGEGTHGATRYYYVVIRANHPTQFWEAPIRIRAGTKLFSRRKQRQMTEQLWKDINDLLANRSQTQGMQLP